MAIDQDTKSVPVAGQDLRHYGCICNFHSINLDRKSFERLGKLSLHHGSHGEKTGEIWPRMHANIRES
jgi:hypothetical protein